MMQKQNVSEDLQQLLRLQQQQKTAHLEKRAELLTEMFADDFINIDSGTITTPTQDEAKERFQTYFDRVEFLAWDNIEEPVIRISKDGTMAYIIVRKFVHLRLPAADGTFEESKTTFAWMEAWEKIDGEWKMTAIASTDHTGGPNG